MNPVERAFTRQAAAALFALLGLVVGILGFVWASSIENDLSTRFGDATSPAMAAQAAQLRIIGLGLGALILAAAAAFWFAAADTVAELDDDG